MKFWQAITRAEIDQLIEIARLAQGMGLSPYTTLNLCN
jgi:hypothetical protein